MQTHKLLPQLAGASPAPMRQGAQLQADNSGAQFSQALSREITQRHNASPAPKPAGKPAEKPAAAKQDGARPADARHADARQAEARQAAARAEGKDKPAAGTGAPGDGGNDEAAEAAARSPEPPVTDMLALVASFNQLQALPKETAPAAAGAGGAAALAAGAAGLAGQDPLAAHGAGGAPELAADSSKFAGLLAQQAEPAALAAPGGAAAPLSGPLQQAALALAQGAAGVANDKIAARVGTPGWDSQLGQKIVWMVAGGDQSATLTLNPPDLGPLQVVLNVSNDLATVTFSASQLEVRQALENALPKLRDMMSESGIALGNATVDAGTPDQRQAQGEQNARASGHGGRFDAGGNRLEGAEAPAGPVRGGASQGMVDIFA